MIWITSMLRMTIVMKIWTRKNSILNNTKALTAGKASLTASHSQTTLSINTCSKWDTLYSQAPTVVEVPATFGVLFLFLSQATMFICRTSTQEPNSVLITPTVLNASTLSPPCPVIYSISTKIERVIAIPLLFQPLGKTKCTISQGWLVVIWQILSTTATYFKTALKCTLSKDGLLSQASMTSTLSSSSTCSNSPYRSELTLFPSPPSKMHKTGLPLWPLWPRWSEYALISHLPTLAQ